MKNLSFKSCNSQPHCKVFSKEDDFPYGHQFEVFLLFNYLLQNILKSIFNRHQCNLHDS